MNKLLAFIWCVFGLLMLTYFVYYAGRDPLALTVFEVIVCVAVVSESSKYLFSSSKK